MYCFCDVFCKFKFFVLMNPTIMWLQINEPYLTLPYLKNIWIWFRDIRIWIWGPEIKHPEIKRTTSCDKFFKYSLATSTTNWAQFFTGRLFFACEDTPNEGIWQFTNSFWCLWSRKLYSFFMWYYCAIMHFEFKRSFISKYKVTIRLLKPFWTDWLLLTLSHFHQMTVCFWSH